MSDPTLRLGPFDVLRAIGRGAMGEVSLALHRASGVEVAIKLLHGTTASDPWAVEAFRNEVRAVSALSHPGIVSVIDHGILSTDSSLVSLGHFTAGTPYLVMEYVKGRPMNRFVGRLSWNQIRAILLQLLDALAHSHARGVVHRDLKPGNVLLATPSGRLPSLKRLQPNHPLEVKLTDFGLAQALDRHSAADAVVAGTPAYMAPEQLQGRWRDQGPWTDLYSVGCLAWAMATGTPPFGKDQPIEEALQHHLHEQPPTFQSVVAVPPGFEGWLRRLLAKSPADRFPRAADAAWGLARISATRERVGAGAIAPLPVIPDYDDEDLESEELVAIDDEPTDFTDAQTNAPVLVVRSRDEAPPEREGTPMPSTWRAPGGTGRSSYMDGVGLNLFGIRPPPFVGRVSERDQLWQALREVYETGIGQAVVLRGPAGMGRSRLGSWLCQRADEVGAARVFTAEHDTDGSGRSGLIPMVTRYLRCDGLPRPEVRDRLAREFPPGDAMNEQLEAISELLAPGDRPESAFWARRFQYPRERFALVRRLLEREATGTSTDDWEAVCVVWLDDAHLGSDTLDFCRFLLESQFADPLPVLLLISVQDEAIATAADPRIVDILETISDHPRCRTLQVHPLNAHTQGNLVRTILGMKSELADQVANRTAGSPKRAVQLVGDWVKRGLLRPTTDGFTLAPDATMDLLDGEDRAWDARTERALVGLPTDEAEALELAAVMGEGRIFTRDWKRACRHRGLTASDRALDRLAAQKLLSLHADSRRHAFSFSRTVFREALVRRARNHGRLQAHHHACAALLEELGTTMPGWSERLGRHLLQAGSVVPALSKLLDGARERHLRGETAAARRLLELRASALKRLDLPPESELWGLGWIEEADLALEEGNLSQCESLLAAVAEQTETHGWSRVQTRVHLLRGRLFARQKELKPALESLEHARTEAVRQQDYSLTSRIWCELGIVHQRSAQLEQALAAFQQAHDLYTRLADDRGLANCAWQSGRAELARGDLDRAEAFLLDAQTRFRALDMRSTSALATNSLGDVARNRGQQHTARDLYRASLEELDALGHPLAVLPRLNLGRVLVEGQRFVEARRLLEPLLRSASFRAQPSLAATAHLCLLATVADAGDWSAWDHHSSRAGGLLAAGTPVTDDNARLAILGAEHAILCGDSERARTAFGLAWQQLDALGLSEAKQALETRVQALSD